MNTWIALITSLPTENATARMRAWRSLKASGAAVLRDGVYLMPEREDCRNTLDSVATDVRAAEGTALVVRLEEPTDGNFIALFDRSAEFANLLGDISTAREGLSPDSANDALNKPASCARHSPTWQSSTSSPAKPGNKPTRPCGTWNSEQPGPCHPMNHIR